MAVVVMVVVTGAEGFIDTIVGMVVIVALVVVDIDIVIASEIRKVFETSINNNYNSNNNSDNNSKNSLTNVLPILLGPCSQNYQDWLSSKHCAVASFEESLIYLKFQRTDDPGL